METDKATIDWEGQEDGYIAKLLVPDGAKDIAVGAPVAVLVDDKADVAAFKDFTIGGGCQNCRCMAVLIGGSRCRSMFGPLPFTVILSHVYCDPQPCAHVSRHAAASTSKAPAAAAAPPAAAPAPVSARSSSSFPPHQVRAHKETGEVSGT